MWQQHRQRMRATVCLCWLTSFLSFFQLFRSTVATGITYNRACNQESFSRTKSFQVLLLLVVGSKTLHPFASFQKLIKLSTRLTVELNGWCRWGPSDDVSCPRGSQSHEFLNSADYFPVPFFVVTLPVGILLNKVPDVSCNTFCLSDDSKGRSESIESCSKRWLCHNVGCFEVIGEFGHLTQLNEFWRVQVHHCITTVQGRVQIVHDLNNKIMVYVIMTLHIQIGEFQTFTK